MTIHPLARFALLYPIVFLCYLFDRRAEQVDWRGNAHSSLCPTNFRMQSGPSYGLSRLFFFYTLFFKQLQCVVLKYADLLSPLSIPASQSLVVEHERIRLLLIRGFHSLHILINSVMRIEWIFSPCFFVFKLAVFQQFSPPKLCVHFFPHTYPAHHIRLDFTVLILHCCLFVCLFISQCS